MNAPRPPLRPTFPDGKRFAFTIFDDTDVATLSSIRPLYDLLRRLGLRTTKTVWPLRFPGASAFAGSHTLQDATYAAYLRDLASDGFEIAYHGPTMESSPREDARLALETFHDTFGTYPRSFASHSLNRDNMYWGENRFAPGPVRWMYNALAKEPKGWFQGDDRDSPYFWGDLCREHIEYVRSFTFSGVDLLRATSQVLYSDPRTPWVRQWFCSNDADNVEEFVDLLTPQRQEELERDGGLCIVSSHLGKGFVSDDRVDPRVERALTEIAGRRGWFVPVSTLLDHLKSQGHGKPISSAARVVLEARWLFDSVTRRSTRKTYRKTELAYLAQDEDVSSSD